MGNSVGIKNVYRRSVSCRAGDGKYDRVVMAMDAIESLARATDPAEDSQILVSIYAKLEDHDMTRTANDETWAGAGIVFPDNRIWVSSVTLNTAASARDAVTVGGYDDWWWWWWWVVVVVTSTMMLTTMTMMIMMMTTTMIYITYHILPNIC